MPCSKLTKDFVVISPDKTATIVANGAGLYDSLDRDFGNFQGHELIACHTFSCDWPTWEVHPNGDEVVVLLSGEVTFVLDRENDEECVALSEPGDYAVVPRGVWHTARVATFASVLFVTPGQDTQNRAISK